MIVVDASVAAKWFLPENGSEEAIALQEGPHQLLAPALIRLEVRAAIMRRVRDPKTPISAETAIDLCGRWLSLLVGGAVALVPEHELLSAAIRLSAEVRHSLQDCLYLAAAAREGLPLVTADEPFYRRATTAFSTVGPLVPLKA
jgi:predicted nucleic acid-binding protein